MGRWVRGWGKGGEGGGGEGGTSEPEVEAKSLSCGSNEKNVPSWEKSSKRHCRPMYSTEKHDNAIITGGVGRCHLKPERSERRADAPSLVARTRAHN